MTDYQDEPEQIVKNIHDSRDSLPDNASPGREDNIEDKASAAGWNAYRNEVLAQLGKEE